MNGDTRPDVALLGHDATDEIFVVQLSRGPQYEAVELTRHPLRVGSFGRPIVTYLTYVGPGAVDVPDEIGQPGAPDPGRLNHDGFVSNYDAQASTLYYWGGGRFVAVLIGD